MVNSFLCFLDEDKLQVNGTSEVEMHNETADSVCFSIMLSDNSIGATFTNPKKLTGQQVLERIRDGYKDEVDDTTFLQVIIPCGDGPHAFIDSKRVREISFETDQWIPSEWTDVGDGDYAVIMTNRLPKVHIGYADSFRFRMYNIRSHAPAGITNISFKLLNTVSDSGGGLDMIHTFQMYKEPARMRILDFSPDRHSAGYGEKVRFTWIACAYGKGEIFPGAFQLGQGGDAFDHVVEGFAKYQLRVERDGESVSRKAPVYLLPPCIREFRFDMASRRVYWDCDYANEVYCLGAKAASRGNAVLPQDAQEARLLCKGHLLTLERTLFLPNGSAAYGLLEKTVMRFPGYCVVCIRWEIRSEYSFRITMGDQQDIISDKRSGSFEYAEIDFPVIAAFLQVSGGQERKILVQKGGAVHL